MQAEWDLDQAEVPTDVRPADTRGFVTGPRGVMRLPPHEPRPVDMSFSPELAEAVREAAEILRPFQTDRSAG